MDPLQVYPNPATAVINIKTDGPCRGAIYNSAGVKVLELNIKDESVHAVNITGLVPGLYLIKLDDKKAVQRFLVK